MSYTLTKRASFSRPKLFRDPKSKNNRVLKDQKKQNLKVDFRTRLVTGFDLAAKLILLAILVYGGFHAHRFVTTSPQFAVSKVSFQGQRVLDNATLNRWSATIEGQNIFTIDMKAITEQLRENPWVAGVSVMRKLPQTLQIRLQERTPYARIQLNRTYLMDNYGVLIASDTGTHDHLPVITGVRSEPVELGREVQVGGLLSGLQAMHFLNRLPYFKDDPINALHVSGKSQLVFTTREKGIEVRLANGHIQEGINNLKIVLSTRDPEIYRTQYIDLSFENKVIIKPLEKKM